MNQMKILIIILILILVYYLIFVRNLHSSDKILKDNTFIVADKLMIVAHPDDELIFGGKELLAEKGWKVVSITNGSLASENIFSTCSFETRQKEFISLMNYLECSYEIWDHEDNGFNSNWNTDILKNQLINLFNETRYKKIVTHNLEGEYGHIQHKKISKIIHDLRPNNLYVFDLDESKINPYLDNFSKLSVFYASQIDLIKKHYKYIVHQSLKKVS